MTIALGSDLGWQSVLVAIAIAIGFALFMTWRARGSVALGFTTFLLQAVVFEASLVLIVSIFYPPLFAVVANQRAFISVVAMMTLIYSARDIMGAFGPSRPDRRKSENGS
jgi:hypothetical protein